MDIETTITETKIWILRAERALKKGSIENADKNLYNILNMLKKRLPHKAPQTKSKD